ncbi:hypothetical protein [Erythrobacter sp. R86502]|uniref:hypothetical protein n=1 Tax=Erythrobacter sp. R86502 TaxID=3093846 RepID=UPI0036D30A26
MNVLNAVPLMTTANSKATAFSLIMRMVQVPCYVVVWEPGQSKGGRGMTARAETSYTKPNEIFNQQSE